MTETLDLVCGPADPLPEAVQSFRLLERLGQGGQADVYKAVRRSSGVSSAPVTLKVFRPSSDRSLDAQYRSWDKGDAVLMDLGTRNVAGICRRIDAFYGPPPHRQGTPAENTSVPYQVLEYLPGSDLSQLLRVKSRRRIDAEQILSTIASVLVDMHEPKEEGIHPALHMDIKAANVIVLPDGSAKVIDFTGSRYISPTHITTISYTPESAGPEAREGKVGASYDVHGFGSVAFFLVTGAKPRSQSNVPVDAPSFTGMRNHPGLVDNPRLRDHLLAPLADMPSDRPQTSELHGWISELVTLIHASRVPDLGMTWSRTGTPTTVRIPKPSTGLHAERNTIVENVTASGGAPMGGAAFGDGRSVTVTAPLSPASPMTRDNAPTSGGGYGRGVAEPTAPRYEPRDPSSYGPGPDEPVEPKRPWRGPGGKFSILSSGSEFSVVGALFAFICWGIWAFDNTRGTFIGHFFMFLFVLLVGAAVFTMARLVGTIVFVKLLKRHRRTARLSHLASGAFLVAVGISFLNTVSWVSHTINWIQSVL